jgi:phosphinothricin acetyltransferase
MPVRIRAADPDRDAAACAAIYAPHVEVGYASFEEVAPDAAETARRMAAAHVWLVAEEDGEVVGFAYADEHRSRAAYRWAADVTVYVAAGAARKGVARALYRDLLAWLREHGFRHACAGIALPNAASVALHEALGFELVGIYRNIGYKAGAWRDVGWWQLQLEPSRS